MAGIKTALLEEPFYIYVALGFAELVLAAIWRERRGRRWALALLVPPVLAGMVFAVEAAVETDREQITRALREIAADAEAGSTAAGARYLDDAYDGFGGSREGVVSHAERTLRSFEIAHVGFVNLRVDVDGRRARTTFSSIIGFRSRGGGAEGKTSLVWDIQWVRREQGWRIIEIARPETRLEL
jgi:hypothetical protein